MKILIIEDEDVMLKTLTEKFTNEKFEVLTAQDGENGLKIALDHRPDIILLDIILPRMDGMTMLNKLRHTNAWGEKVPVVLLTNLNADDEIMKGVIENEPAFFLLKSNWTLEGVVKKVNERLARENLITNS